MITAAARYLGHNAISQIILANRVVGQGHVHFRNLTDHPGDEGVAVGAGPGGVFRWVWVAVNHLIQLINNPLGLLTADIRNQRRRRAIPGTIRVVWPGLDHVVTPARDFMNIIAIGARLFGADPGMQ